MIEGPYNVETRITPRGVVHWARVVYRHGAATKTMQTRCGRYGYRFGLDKPGVRCFRCQQLAKEDEGS